MIGILIVLIFSSSLAYSSQLPPLQFKKLQLPQQTVGPDSTAFDLKGNGPYTSVADGRVLKYQGPNIGFIDFATTSPLRPLGVGFYYKTGDLYITDINYGLLSVGSNGGLATQLVSGIDGVPFAFADALDVDQIGGVIYFIDSGLIFRTRFAHSIFNELWIFRDVVKSTYQVILIYVLITEIIASRIRRFWLKGPKANSTEIFANLTGHPDNIKRTILGDYCVAVNIVKQQQTPTIFALAQRVDVLGNVVLSLNLTAQYPNSFSEKKMTTSTEQQNGSVGTTAGMATASSSRTTPAPAMAPAEKSKKFSRVDFKCWQ
ncbi:protein STRICTOSIDINE SYNTHASE-LIKE 10-like [Nicotiana tomentosiformis]|uniref:protein STRICTOSIDINE SYNTHASE-LIKE 10-like n=1 Tax=Nicotiana tomentosiformis TaxID=4098 RepID=UPI00388C8B7A